MAVDHEEQQRRLLDIASELEEVQMKLRQPNVSYQWVYSRLVTLKLEVGRVAAVYGEGQPV